MKQNDLGLGLIYLILGGLGLLIGIHYPIGSVARMGPGFLPTVISILLLIFAAISLFRAVAAGRPDFMPLSEVIKSSIPVAIIIGSVVVFAAVCGLIGLFPSTLLLMVMSAIASPEFRIKPVPVIGVIGVAGVFSYMFVKLLGLPIPFINLAW